MQNIFCSINSGAIWGIEPYIVNVETDISPGMPYFNMVGLLSSEVKEARERVRTAIRNSGEEIPMYRVTVNLSPADRRKDGTGFDLAIAISLLCAMGRLDNRTFSNALIIGELGLNGEIKSVDGILPLVSLAKSMGYGYCIIPKGNIDEGQVIKGISVIAFDTLAELIEFFNNNNGYDDYYKRIREKDNCIYNKNEGESILKGSVSGGKCNKDFLDISGQDNVKRAIIIAVTGCHNLLMTGAPGVGKSMLASRIPYIMPDMSEEEKMEVAMIRSICGMFNGKECMDIRPFSAPYHTITAAALVGGGNIPKPGEITKANKGVLFLDELPEFGQNVIDSLRQPLENRYINIHRMSGNFTFPADCMVVAAMNLCKCGYFPDRSKCNCSERDIKNYLSRVSGPVADRIDMCVEVPRVRVSEIGKCDERYSTFNMKKRVEKAIEFRMEHNRRIPNSRILNEDIAEVICLEKKAGDFLKDAYVKFELSMRGYYKILKVARTIADLDESGDIKVKHIAEALGYRMIKV